MYSIIRRCLSYITIHACAHTRFITRAGKGDLPCPARQKWLRILPGQGGLAQEDGQLASFGVRTRNHERQQLAMLPLRPF